MALVTIREYVAARGGKPSEKTMRRLVRRLIEVYHAACALEGVPPKPVEVRLGARKTYYDLSVLPFLESNRDK